MTQVGYSDPKAFREVFRKMVGLSPVEYRSMIGSAGAQRILKHRLVIVSGDAGKIVEKCKFGQALFPKH